MEASIESRDAHEINILPRARCFPRAWSHRGFILSVVDWHVTVDHGAGKVGYMPGGVHDVLAFGPTEGRTS